jgi:hypothetical protein
MKNSILLRDDVRRLVVGLDEITVGLHELEAATALDPHPELQCDLRCYADVIKRAANFLADLQERLHL